MIRIERTTYALRKRCSTTELHRHTFLRRTPELPFSGSLTIRFNFYEAVAQGEGEASEGGFEFMSGDGDSAEISRKLQTRPTI